MFVALSAFAQAPDTTSTAAPDSTTVQAADTTAMEPVPTGPDRSAPPAIGEVKPFTLPKVERFKLDNGLRVLLLEDHGVPLVQLNLLVEAGRLREEPGKYGLAGLTADMLDEGATDTFTTTSADTLDEEPETTVKTMTSLQISEAMEYLGARFRISTDAYTTSIRVGVPSGRLEAAMNVASFVLLNPAFSADELERLRNQRLTDLLSLHDNPTAIADVQFEKTLFGEAHAYGRTNIGSEASLRALTVGDVKGFYNAFYRPNNATLVVVGDVTRDGIRGRHPDGVTGVRAQDLPGRQTRRGAVRHSNRATGSTPHQQGLLQPASAQHGAGRLVYVAAQPEPSRGQGLHLRRVFALRFRSAREPVYGGGVGRDQRHGRLVIRVHE
jgi:hypothetical protein